MNWLIIVIVLCVVVLLLAGISKSNGYDWITTGVGIGGTVVILGLFIPLVIVVENIEDKHDWYIETRLKYAEAEGIEKMYLEMNDVMTYNLWYEKNKEDLENPWNFKSAAGCEFDYIKIQGETK